MSERQLRILTLLRRDIKVSTSTLAAEVDAPEASVRRDIQVLRRQGYSIGYATDDGLYRYYGA